MNKQQFWTIINNAFDKAEDGLLCLSVDFLGYHDKDSGDIAEVDYAAEDLTLEILINYLRELEKDKLINLIDTENMNYFITRK